MKTRTMNSEGWVLKPASLSASWPKGPPLRCPSRRSTAETVAPLTFEIIDEWDSEGGLLRLT